MGDKLKGKVAVITGSGQGIGKAIAIALAQEGAKVVTSHRKPGTEGGDAQTAAEEIKNAGGEAVPFFGDAGKFDEAEKLIKTAVDSFGSVDILVNNAGADAPRMVWNMSEEEWDKSLNSYLKSTFNCTRHATRIMREKKWGRIINMTSDAFLGTVGHANYGAAKGGIVSFSRSVAREMGRCFVTCNAISPEAATRFTLAPEVVEGFKKRYETGLITRERYEEVINIPPPECLGPFIIYLCTDEAQNVNGQVFRISGGEVAIYSESVRAKTIYKDHQKDGLWTVEELVKIVPKTLLAGYTNPAPPETKEK
ncbi:MAG TPA: short-chain dehydrogenase [Desulfotomaculum sp.]|nr:short-chain dehydrogenase [Desulfotomaculum sp.]